jgi:hypothetical protein
MADGLLTDYAPITWDGFLGHTIELRLDDGTVIEYNHVMDVPTHVIGTRVKKGDFIGRVYDGRPGGVNHLDLHVFTRNPFTSLPFDFGVWNFPANGPRGYGTWGGAKVETSCNASPTDPSDYNRDGHPDLYAIHRHDPNGDRTSVHVLNGADGFQSYLQQVRTSKHVTDEPGRWSFLLGDYNRDGVNYICQVGKIIA